MNINFEIYNKSIIDFKFNQNNLILHTNNYSIIFNDYIIIIDDLNNLLNQTILNIIKIDIPNNFKIENIYNDEEIIYLNCYEIILKNSIKTFKMIKISNNSSKLFAKIIKN